MKEAGLPFVTSAWSEVEDGHSRVPGLRLSLARDRAGDSLGLSACSVMMALDQGHERQARPAVRGSGEELRCWSQVSLVQTFF